VLKFSIVIPTKDRSQYLRYALQSCLSQTYGDFEVVVSDNNSQDDTRDVVLAAEDPRVRYVNTGRSIDVTANFEHGVLQARGEFCSWPMMKPTAQRRLQN
jgi:glycosyltransferase involved in cell wall biosynthesis